MKKTLISKIVVFLLIPILFTGCGGNSNTSNTEETKPVTVKPKAVQIKGDLGDYYEVVNRDFQIKDGLITVEVKRNMKDFIFSTNGLDPYGTSGEGVLGLYGFGIELYGNAGPEEIKNATSGGMGGPYSNEDVTGLFKLKKGETGFIRWTVEKPENIKTFQLTSAITLPDGSAKSSGSASSNCDQFIKDYEAFVDSYIKLLKKYKANPSDPTILQEYTDAVQKASEMQTEASNCTDAKYVNRLTKIVNKLATAAASMN